MSVKRITIDERLDKELVRVLVSELKGKDVEKGCFSIRDVHAADFWPEEKSMLVSTKDFAKKLGFDEWSAESREKAVKQIIGLEPERLNRDESDDKETIQQKIFKNLVEGQVFLSGGFSIEGDPETLIQKEPQVSLVLDDTKHEFLRVDRLEPFKDEVSMLYLRALRVRAER